MVNLFINDELVESVNFPITDVGDSSTVSAIVQNPLSNKVELVPFSNDEDVEVLEYPRTLGPMESAKAVWKFSPNKERLVPLRSKIGFKEIIG